ncbi:HAD family hydrolase [Cereibacter azotoformans]|uniref:phosphoglycolate phosphatase n=2 Tax=Cereibacter TaxID=1653176 RepID=A0A2T5KBY6_9RHOB|nr:HAD family hydrolase [Cereibacter azotoformans]AXQ94214.1 HAD family hydrolase [Cereibacter sphaeroides]MBO4167977.1 HAD family hydrolase [Cereibacter azotoformans]PTR19909.1 phosphoglycolate phosphatase [Cereibacter azotoformans]UIJ29753.1 HAD family hydrolase [Cereibacter azotoformans]ULB10439.1 HAD family hydrolase [Cereibacter azotoformans]
MIHGIIFDKDGTLFDFRRSWGAWSAHLLREIAADEGQARGLAEAIGYDMETGAFAPWSPVIASTADEIADRLLPLLPGWDKRALVTRMNLLAAGAEMSEAVPLAPLLAALRARGLKIGLATNDSEAPARAHLGRHGLTELFDFIAGADSGHGGKPEPGMLLAFADRVGIAPGNVVMVGDSAHDLLAGRAAGMRTVAVLTGIAVAEELSEHADVILPDIGGLADWIDGLAAA